MTATPLQCSMLQRFGSRVRALSYFTENQHGYGSEPPKRARSNLYSMLRQGLIALSGAGYVITSKGRLLLDSSGKGEGHDSTRDVLARPVYRPTAWTSCRDGADDNLRCLSLPMGAQIRRVGA